MYYLFAFRSRASSMQFFESLKREGIDCVMVSTPKEIALGCGLSVKVNSQFAENARKVFNSRPLNSFLGLFRVEKDMAGNVVYKRI